MTSVQMELSRREWVKAPRRVWARLKRERYADLNIDLEGRERDNS